MTRIGGGESRRHKGARGPSAAAVLWGMAAVGVVLVVVILARSGILPPADRWLAGLSGNSGGGTPAKASAGNTPTDPAGSVGIAGNIDKLPSALPARGETRGASVAPAAQHNGYAGARADAESRTLATASARNADSDEFAATPEDEPADDPRSLSITGWVRTGTGQPVAGLGVEATLTRAFDASEQSFGSVQTRMSVGTGTDGGFALGPLVNGEYQVRTVSDGYYRTAAKLVRAGTAAVVLVVEETGYREIYLFGTVSAPDGAPLAGVRVLPIGIRLADTVYTDAAGGYSLYLPVHDDDRTYSVRFKLDGYRPQSLPLRVADAGDSASLQLDAQLDPLDTLTTVSGRVTDQDGTPLKGAAVQIVSLNTLQNRRALSDRNGDYRLTDIEVGGNYRLWVRRSGYRDYQGEGLVVESAGTRFDIALETLHTGSLAGQMTDSQGNPVPNFTLWARSAVATTVQPLPVTADSSGNFVVDNLPEGPISLSSLSAPRMTVVGIELSPEIRAEARIVLDTGPHRARGQVLDQHNQPVAGARVSLRWSHSQGDTVSQSSRETVADTTGRFEFGQLGPGPHKLIVQAPGFQTARAEYDSGAQAGPLSITLQDLHR